MSKFVKMMRSDVHEALSQYPYANHMLNVIAYRARRTPDSIKGLQVGEAIISASSLGLTDSQYRHAKKQLTKFGLATFTATNKYTCGKLTNTIAYDINEETNDEQTTSKRRAKAQSSDDKLRMEELKNEIMKEYNTLCESSSWPQIIKLDGSRDTALKNRLKDCEEFKIEFIDFLKMAHGSDFLRNGNGTWKCNFDWLVSKKNFLKVVEGNYKNQAPQKINKNLSEGDEIDWDAEKKQGRLAI